MTDHFTILPIRKLFQLITNQLDTEKQFFGIPQEIFFTPVPGDSFRMVRFGQLLETPLGVAAGPHTQMAQNIVGAWLCGARFMELKTVQTLDDLSVSKPCIDMQDEGYNCEWSQELKIKESYDQYLNAWILIHILRHKFGWNNGESGTIFNMSVGYDMKGILKKNVQWFFNKMADCSKEKKEKLLLLEELYPNIHEVFIPDRISDNITLSTMHGCPPHEIEKIGQYLLETKNLHTTIKLNPTLLGKDELLEILGNSGFKTDVPDEAFEHDLKFEEAQEIIKNLRKIASERNLFFGVKLTNTLECRNNKSVLPENEKMMYMSGRALHPIAISLAHKIQSIFQDPLDISFSAGVNAFNFPDVIRCGLAPVTVCSDILKPGGYGLLSQYIDILNKGSITTGDSDKNDADQAEYSFETFTEKEFARLTNYKMEVLNNPSYRTHSFQTPDIKSNRPLDLFDCVEAPCISACATHQDIPTYMHYVSKDNPAAALQTILDTNPFPNSTGFVCDHMCQTKCTRMNYESSLRIRDIKRFVAEQIPLTNQSFESQTNPWRAAVIGAGPSGLSCAYYLTMAGAKVEVFEDKSYSGGMVSAAIPVFRLPESAYQKDIKHISDVGVNIHYDEKVDKNLFNRLTRNYNFVYIATGAPRSRKFLIEGINSPGVLDPLEFLFAAKGSKQMSVGQKVVVVGGGNTAMDAARTARRLAEADAEVSILYRRSFDQMPADEAEIRSAQEEGITIQELVLPIQVNQSGGRISSITCIRMKLEGLDSAGRPKPVMVQGSEFDVDCDTLLPAIGQDPDFDYADPELLVANTGSFETRIPGVYIGGDARRGASTLINAVADGRKAAERIIDVAFPHQKANKKRENTETADQRLLMIKRMKKENQVPPREIPLNKRLNFDQVILPMEPFEARKEAGRCLQCDQVCNTCVTVCPNLALYSYNVNPVDVVPDKILAEGATFSITKGSTVRIAQVPQILHIVDWCNACGNCNTFCPTADAPYKKKPHLCLEKDTFDQNDDCYFLDISTGSGAILIYKKGKDNWSLKRQDSGYRFTINDSSINLTGDFKIREHNFKVEKDVSSLEMAVTMEVVLTGALAFSGVKM